MHDDRGGRVAQGGGQLGEGVPPRGAHIDRKGGERKFAAIAPHFGCPLSGTPGPRQAAKSKQCKTANKVTRI
jgi:hypothetical protein